MAKPVILAVDDDHEVLAAIASDLRRHYRDDYRILSASSGPEALAAVQLEILHACFRMLAPGGRLLYATCSVLPAENHEVLAEFLKTHRRARSLPVALAAQVPGALPTGNEASAGVQLLPGAEAGTDGFHYACVEKTTDGT